MALPALPPLAARGELEVRPGRAIPVKATEPLVVLSVPVGAGQPVAQGTLLAEFDLRSLHRAYDDAADELESLKAERRQNPPLGGRVAPPLNEKDLAIAASASELLDLQSRIAQAAVRAPEDGCVVRYLYAVGAKARKRKPFLEFARLADLRVRLALPAAEAGRFPIGRELELAAVGDDSRRFRGRVESASPRDGAVELSIRPLELPFLALGVAEELRLTD